MKTILIFLVILFINITATKAEETNPLPTLDIYNIDLSLLNTFDRVEKGTDLNLILLNNISSKEKENKEPLYFTLNNGDKSLHTTGFISMSSRGKRLSKSGTLELSTDKLFLDDGREINLSASSPSFKGAHPPHANSNSLGLARAITSLAFTSSPATFGASLGISFLVNGILSAHRNGISDFVWGGLDGSGLSFVENILRKQPDIYFERGTVIPFTLNEDLKISKGIQKEKFELVNISKDEAINKIQQFLNWGDLTGAIELSAKTGQEEIYNELLDKISL